MPELDYTRPASDDNPLPRKTDGREYMSAVGLAAKLDVSVERAREIITDDGCARWPWFGGQLDILKKDADRIIEARRTAD